MFYMCFIFSDRFSWTIYKSPQFQNFIFVTAFNITSFRTLFQTTDLLEQNIIQRSSVLRICRHWNELPNSIKTIKSVNIFILRVYIYLKLGGRYNIEPYYVQYALKHTACFGILSLKVISVYIISLFIIVYRGIG